MDVTEGKDSAYDFSIIRVLRTAQGMTLRDVTEKTGVSGAVISRLERNMASPELETLYRVAKCFGMNTTDLIRLAESRTTEFKKESVHNSDLFHFRSMTYGNARILFGRSAHGGRTSKPTIHHDQYEICWVLKGRIRLILPQETYELGPGDSLQFDAVLQHVYESTEDDTELIIILLKKEKRF